MSSVAHPQDQGRHWPSSQRFCSHLVSFSFYLNVLLFFIPPGTALVIPPLQTIQHQMCMVCEDWGITYLNLSSIDGSTIGDQIAEYAPQILIASIENISDPIIQKQLFNLKLEYISVDEAQVTI